MSKNKKFYEALDVYMHIKDSVWKDEYFSTWINRSEPEVGDSVEVTRIRYLDHVCGERLGHGNGKIVRKYQDNHHEIYEVQVLGNTYKYKRSELRLKEDKNEKKEEFTCSKCKEKEMTPELASSRLISEMLRPGKEMDYYLIRDLIRKGAKLDFISSKGYNYEELAGIEGRFDIVDLIATARYRKV